MPQKRSKRVLQIFLAVGTAISLFFVPWPLIKAWIIPLPDTIEEQLDEALTHGFDGIVVYVNQTGHEPGFYAAGWKNRAEKIPADPHALFKIASIGKLYNAAAIAKLVGSGQLSLDKTLGEYFPELAGRIENTDEITLRMMVQHRSGIPNFTDTPNFWVDPPKGSQETLALILDKPANFEPDADYEYSNTNYLLIALLIEKVTGKSAFEYIKESILNPLGLKNTFGSIHDVNLDDVMSGYYVGIEEDIKTADYGSMLATAEDVGIFIRALNDGSLFEGDEQAIYSSIYKYEHTGLVAGYQSIAEYHKDIDAVVIQFTNTTNFDGYEWNLSEIVYNRIVKIVRKQSEN
ncbi:beta-lactamase family protein [Marinilongibacter aquaticus]|uniref:serine hydrolase domain-containing protein n=1 Tax=Marinilongibacter aquaticus TaxID=2975157 RepID=UPI0021BD9AD7|nr:serine hydrolase domain-containing protein [Marinilongibacter aquaticus]UBM59521.1 beta-lactamase family protein [Marinilongibacter aquaticus]